MFRRTFIHLAALSVLPIAKENADPPENEYVYDWTSLSVPTNDPGISELPIGVIHYRITLDGKDFPFSEKYVTACKIGPNGWIEEQVIHGGKPVIDLPVIDLPADSTLDWYCKYAGKEFMPQGKVKVRRSNGVVKLWIDGVKR